MQKNRGETIAQIQQCEKELKTLRTELGKTETTINTIVTDMQKIETKNSKAKVIYDKVKGMYAFTGKLVVLQVSWGF